MVNIEDVRDLAPEVLGFIYNDDAVEEMRYVSRSARSFCTSKAPEKLPITPYVEMNALGDYEVQQDPEAVTKQVHWPSVGVVNLEIPARKTEKLPKNFPKPPQCLHTLDIRMLGGDLEDVSSFLLNALNSWFTPNLKHLTIHGIGGMDDTGSDSALLGAVAECVKKAKNLESFDLRFEDREISTSDFQQMATALKMRRSTLKHLALDFSECSVEPPTDKDQTFCDLGFNIDLFTAWSSNKNAKLLSEALAACTELQEVNLRMESSYAFLGHTDGFEFLMVSWAEQAMIYQTKLTQLTLAFAKSLCDSIKGCRSINRLVELSPKLKSLTLDLAGASVADAWPLDIKAPESLKTLEIIHDTDSEEDINVLMSRIAEAFQLTPVTHLHSGFDSDRDDDEDVEQDWANEGQEVL